MPTVPDRGTSNPLIVVSKEEVAHWLRQLADEAGFSDRETCAYQTKINQADFCWDTPELIIMVSNIANSRQKESDEA